MNNLLTKQLTKRMFTVCLEGNIGSGKSSSLNYLSQKYDKLMTVSEPIDKWQDLRGYNWIELLYKDLNRYSFGFEHFAQLTRLEMFGNADQNGHNSKPIRLMERSIFSARNCFSENLFQNGNLTKPEYVILDEWFKWLSAKSCLKVDLIIYLRTSPQTVFQRIQNRSRDEETNISIKYLEDLHKLHDNWLLGEDRGTDEPTVVALDADLDQKQMFSLLDQKFERIFKQLSENSASIDLI